MRATRPFNWLTFKDRPDSSIRMTDPGNTHAAHSPRQLAWVLFPMLFSFLWCFLFGRLGFHPLDSSIVFDGATRLLNGQRFFVEFQAPAGFTPAFIQSFFFRVLGVTWFAYLLHAAIFNALFSLLSYRILRPRKLSGFDLPRPIAAFYSLLSGLVFYAPFGTPYPDQHAFFFSLLAVHLLLSARTARLDWKAALQLALVLPCLLLALLSKQVPSAYAALLIGLLAAISFPLKKWPAVALRLLAGLPIAALLLWLLFDLRNIDLHQAWFYFWEMPRDLGRERYAELGFPPLKMLRTVLFRQFQVLCGHGKWHFWTSYWLPLLAIAGLGIRFARRKSLPENLRKATSKPFPKDFWLTWLLAWGLLAIGGGFVALTQNQQENGLAFVFLALGLVHAGWLGGLGFAADILPAWKDRLKISLAVIAVALMGHAAWDAYHFQVGVVSSRMVHDFAEESGPDFKWPWEVDGENAGKGLSALVWEEPYVGKGRNPAELLDFLEKEGETFFLWGDMAFLNGLSGQNSPMPSLWLHEGLSVPAVGSEWRAAWDQDLVLNLEKMSPGFLVFEVEGGKSYMGEKLEDHPKAHAWLMERAGDPFKVGGYFLYPLSPDPARHTPDPGRGAVPPLPSDSLPEVPPSPTGP